MLQAGFRPCAASARGARRQVVRRPIRLPGFSEGPEQGRIAEAGDVIAEDLAIFGDPGLGVFKDADEIEADQIVRAGAAGAPFELVGDLLDGVRSLASGAKLHQLFELLAVAGDAGIEPWIGGGVDVDGRPHQRLGLAEDLLRALVGMGFPDGLALKMRGPFDGAVEGDGPWSWFRPLAPRIPWSIGFHISPRRVSDE